MEAHIQYDGYTDDVKIFLVQRDVEGRRVAEFYAFNNGSVVATTVDRGQPVRIEPALIVPEGSGRELLRALGEALVKAGYYTPPVAPVVAINDVLAHLADAIQVRDRLLTMAEKANDV